MMVLQEPIARGNILVIQLGIKATSYRNTKGNNSCNIKHDEQGLLYLF